MNESLFPRYVKLSQGSQERDLRRVMAETQVLSAVLDSIQSNRPVAVGFPDRTFARPDLGHEQTGTLNADAVTLQKLLTLVDDCVAKASELRGDAITKPANDAFSDFLKGMSDVRSDVQYIYDSFDSELEGRD
jgi:hypothetical protein